MKLKMTAQADGKTFTEAFDEFMRYCSVRNFSSATIANYRQLKMQFSKCWNVEQELIMLDSEAIEEFLLHLKSDNQLSDMSLAMYFKNMKALLNYFSRKGYMQPVEMPKLKLEKKIKETYSDAELSLLLKKPNLHHCDFCEYRNWVIVNYLLSTGNRVSTVINLRISDIDFEDQFIRLTKTKNRKQQIIPLSNTLAMILTEYLTVRKGKEDDFLFCTMYGMPLTRSSISIAIRHYNRSRGVTKTSIHLFRHTFAKKWIMAGGDIFRLQKVLGHSTLDVVKEYVNMFSDDLQQDYNKFNALEQLSKPKNHIGL
jgi:integrase/recombinase XerD